MAKTAIKAFIPKGKQLDEKLAKRDANGKFITKVIFQRQGADELCLGQFWEADEATATATRQKLRDAIESETAIDFDAGDTKPDQYTPGYDKVTYLYWPRPGGGFTGGRPPAPKAGYTGQNFTEAQFLKANQTLFSFYNLMFKEIVDPIERSKFIQAAMERAIVSWGNNVWTPNL